MESLGELIKRTLKDKGIKESFVAKKMNVSKQVINQIDRRKNFDLAFLTDLKDATDLDFTKYIVTKYPNSNDNTSISKVEESNTEYTTGKAATLTLNFEIPTVAYKNLSAFMKEVNSIAEAHGLKPL